MRGDFNSGAAPVPDPEEQALLRRIREGGMECLAEIIDRHGEDLMRYLRSLLRDREAAEETFQETWIQVIRKIRRVDPARPFAPWLFRVARNLAYDRLRRRRRWSFFGLEEARSGSRTGSGAARADAAERLAETDLAERLLSKLEAPYREMIWLRFYRDCSYEEIAGICRVPVGTVKSRLRRALDRLGALNEELEALPHENSAC